MPETSDPAQPKKQPLAQKLLLVLALVTSPLGCCGCAFLVDILPTSLMPPALSFILNTFEAEARIENRTGEVLNLTPFSTTTGRPVVIKQPTSLRQRQIPLAPNGAIVFTYDAADMPLTGVAVCRTEADCRWIPANSSDDLYVDSFEALPELEPGWLQALQTQARYSFDLVLMPLLGLLPIALFGGWLYWGYTRK